MKKSIKQFTDQIIADNKEFIGQEKICDYLINEAENIENGFYEYYSDEDYIKAGWDIEFSEKLDEEIKSFLRANYNYYINE